MADGAAKRHEHRGRSSQGLLDPMKILKDMGLRRGDRFLDAGCGEGHFSLVASELVGGEGLVYALDADEEAISRLKAKIAEKKIANIEALVADISRRLPLADRSVDLVLVANVLHGLVANGDADSALQDLARVTRPSGRLLVVDFKKMETPMGPPLSMRLGPEEVEELMAGYGFGKAEVSEAGPYHYEIVLTRV